LRVFFKCKRSGNIISFVNEDDIASTRTHEGYEEIADAMPDTAPKEAEAPKEVEYCPVITAKDFKKKLGRPPKKK